MIAIKVVIKKGTCILIIFETEWFCYKCLIDTTSSYVNS
nr:hypothetical protein [Providencia rettgeri]